MPAALTTPRLVLRAPVAADAALLCAYHARNEARFAPWEPQRGREVADHLAWIVWRQAEHQAGRAASFLAFDREAGDALVAEVNLDAITHAPDSTAMLSYTVDGAYEGKGYAREAVGATIAYAYETLDLRNLSATYDPANARSGGLLRRLGFVVIAQTPVIPGMERHMRAQVLAGHRRPNATAQA
jgi:[ribosomal protein S5]-alanine N-acetyltransferase